jgi:UPF0716 protein FxsA
MFARLFILFAIVPIIEIYLFVLIGTEIGALNTVAVVLVTAFVGAWLARSQGASALARIQNALNQGQMPANELIDGVLILAAGIVLLTPGFFTDVIGFLLLIPQTRNWLKRELRKRFERSIQQGNVHVRFYGGGAGGPFGPFGPGGPQARRRPDECSHDDARDCEPDEPEYIESDRSNSGPNRRRG